MNWKRNLSVTFAVVAGWVTLGVNSVTAQYLQKNLVGYQKGMGHHLDPYLNGWGLAFAPDGAFCVADTSTGVATFYDHSGQPLPLVITVPPAASLPLGPVGTPAGIVYNSTSDFVITAHGRSAPALFIFDTLDGTISGWNPAVDATHAIIMVDNSTEPIPASYEGLALGQNSHGQNVLYAADGGLSLDASNNRIDMFDGNYELLGSFTDSTVTSDYPGNTAFQVENEDGKLYVTFGGFTKPFGGVVDVFDMDGHLLKRLAANAPGDGPLVNPWGIAQAPSDFGPFSNALLIGNVEDGRINAFDPITGEFLGQLLGLDGMAIEIPGLWDLAFGGGGKNNGKKTNELFFTAGLTAADPTGNGLFGSISAVGKPAQPKK